MVDQKWYSRPPDVPEDIGAGGVVARWEENHWMVALVREGKNSDYILPKGSLEKGESLELAARREIREEAGLSGLRRIAYLGTYGRLNFQRTRWKKTHYFLFLSENRYGRPTDQNHDYRCEWFPFDHLPALFWPEQREVIEKARRELSQRPPPGPSASARPRR